jgi:hypothetical protein
MMDISHVAWIHDARRRPVLQLSLGGYLAHFPSAQPLELLRRGLLKGVHFFTSEARDQADHPFIRARIESGLSDKQLEGCTDDPRVVILHRKMCQAISAGTWRPGPRPGSADEADGRPAVGQPRTWTRGAWGGRSEGRQQPPNRSHAEARRVQQDGLEGGTRG